MTAIGALIGLLVSVLLIIKKISPAYSLIAGAIVGGLLGGLPLTETVKVMTDGVKDVTPAIHPYFLQQGYCPVCLLKQEQRLPSLMLL